MRANFLEILTHFSLKSQRLLTVSNRYKQRNIKLLSL